MKADIYDFHYFCVFLVYKITAYAKTEHWEHNYLISNWTGEKEAKYRRICFLHDKKPLRIHGAGGVGSNDTFDFRAWRKTNPCKENRFHVICVEYVKRPKRSYSSLWVNGSCVTNFNSTASSESTLLEIFVMVEIYHFSELLLQWKSMWVSPKGYLVI